MPSLTLSEIGTFTLVYPFILIADSTIRQWGLRHQTTETVCQRKVAYTSLAVALLRKPSSVQPRPRLYACTSICNVSSDNEASESSVNAD